MKRDDIGFRLGTGVFGGLLIAVVAGIAVVLYTDAATAIQKFGWQFWQTEIWDPIAGEFGARPFIWGTLYSAVLALIIAGPIALGIAIFISELCPAPLRRPPRRLLDANPRSVQGGGIFSRNGLASEPIDRLYNVTI